MLKKMLAGKRKTHSFKMFKSHERGHMKRSRVADDERDQDLTRKRPNIEAKSKDTPSRPWVESSSSTVEVDLSPARRRLRLLHRSTLESKGEDPHAPVLRRNKHQPYITSQAYDYSPSKSSSSFSQGRRSKAKRPSSRRTTPHQLARNSSKSSIVFKYSKDSISTGRDFSISAASGKVHVPSECDTGMVADIRVESRPSVIPCMDPFSVPSDPCLEHRLRSSFSSNTSLAQKASSRVLSSADIFQHNATHKPEWVVLNDKVYDVRSFLKENPKAERQFLDNYYAGSYKQQSVPIKKQKASTSSTINSSEPQVKQLVVAPSALDHLAQNCFVVYGPHVYDLARYAKEQPKVLKRLKKYLIGELSPDDPQFRGLSASCCRYGWSSSTEETNNGTVDETSDDESVSALSGEKVFFQRILRCSIC